MFAINILSRRFLFLKFFILYLQSQQNNKAVKSETDYRQ